MMKLSIMRTIVETLDSKGESDLAHEIVRKWSGNIDFAKHFRTNSNAVFFCEWAGKNYVLRFKHADQNSFQNIQSEIEFINKLLAIGIPAAKPVLSGRKLPGVDFH